MNTIVINQSGTIKFDERTIKEGAKYSVKDGIFYLEGKEIVQEYLFHREYDPYVLATFKTETLKRDWRGKWFAVGWVTHAYPKPISIVTNNFCIIGGNDLVNWE